LSVWRSPAQANPPSAVHPSAAPVTLAIVATPYGVESRASEVRFVTLGSTTSPEDESVTIAHAPGAVVRGDVLPGTPRSVVIVADAEGGRTDFASTLWRVDASVPSTRSARALAHGVYHASRPLGSIDGQIYAERGEQGPAPSLDRARAGELRTDRLVIDAIDPATGTARTLMTARGYTLHLAGELGGELFVYRVDASGADLVAVDRQSGKTRLVATLPPFARDFTVDGRRGAIALSNRDEHDAHLWVTERIDLATGARTRLAAVRDKSPAPPFVLPDGRDARSIAPLGPGFDAIAASSAGGTWIALLHAAADGSEAAAAVHLPSGAVIRLGSRSERVEVLGFEGAAGASTR
jgi:hypothetical protein